MYFKNIMTGLVLLFVAAQGYAQSADKILAEACSQAKKEHKNVIVMFHASWCGWCKKMDASMNDKTTKALFDKNYVTTHIVVNESKGKENLNNPGGIEMLKKYNLAEQGIPTWLIFDENGKLLADSNIRPDGSFTGAKGENIGCPAQDNEVAEFIKD